VHSGFFWSQFIFVEASYLCFVYFLFVIVCLVVSTSAIDCLERLISEMISYVLSETLNYTLPVNI